MPIRTRTGVRRSGRPSLPPPSGSSGGVDRVRGTAEHHHEPVALGLDDVAAVPGHLGTHRPVVGGQETDEGVVTERAR